MSSVSNGYSAEERLEGMNLQLGDWHSGMKLLCVSNNKSILFDNCKHIKISKFVGDGSWVPCMICESQFSTNIMKQAQ